jgi:hypothetical protein
LIESCGVEIPFDADGASGVIIEAVWEKLQQNKKFQNQNQCIILNVNSIDRIRAHRGVPSISSLLFHACSGTLVLLWLLIAFSHVFALSKC